MRRIALALVFAGACSSGASPPSTETLNAACIRKTLALYQRHSLPFTAPASERPALCQAFLAEQEITTHAGLEIAMRSFDQELRDLAR